MSEINYTPQKEEVSVFIFKKRLSSVILSEAKQSDEVPRKARDKFSLDEKIWFFDMQGDGSSLSKAKKFGPQYKNDIPKLLELWSKNKTVAKPYSWFTSVKDILENDHILSANTYNPYSGEETTTHREPKEILGEIESEEKKLGSALREIKRLI